MERILIEGLNLTWKTTLCNNLVANYADEFTYKNRYYTIDNPLYWEAVNKTKDKFSEEVVGWLYSAATQYELEMLINDKNIFKSDKIIIQDSLFLNRTIGFHSIKERIMLLNVIKDIINKMEKPNKTFYLYTSLESKIRRFYERKEEKKAEISDKLVFEKNTLAEKREKIMREFMIERYNAEVIDTTNVNKEELTKLIYNKIKKGR